MTRPAANLVFVALLGACFNTPAARAENFYASTDTLNTILRVDSGGNASTFATSASGLNYPNGLAVAGSGNLFVANGSANTIEEFSPGGTGVVFASTGLSAPLGLTFDSSGNLYVGNLGNNTIEEFNSYGTGSVFATSGFDEPAGLAFDDNGNLFVANQGDYTIEQFTPGGTGSVFATAASGVDNPWGLAFYSGNLYVANHGNNTIEKFNASGIGTTFASLSTNGVGRDLLGPIGLAFDRSGNLFVTTIANGGDLLEIDPEGDVSGFASGLGGAGYLAIDDIPEPSALLLLGFGLSALAIAHKRRR